MITREQVEAFRKEYLIPINPMDDVPWAVEENLILNTLCDSYLAKEMDSLRERIDRDDNNRDIGEAFLETLRRNDPGYSWNNCPTEWVVDQINKYDELKANAINGFVKKILHGDHAHRAWLLYEAETYIAIDAAKESK